MCGRYSTTRQDQLVAEMELAIADEPGAGVLAVAPGFPAGLDSWWAPRWNVAPTQPAPVVVMREAVATLCLMRWGLVPHWADDLAVLDETGLDRDGDFGGAVGGCHTLILRPNRRSRNYRILAT